RREVVGNNGGAVMAAKMNVHEGVIRPSLVDELEQFRAQNGRVSSYYLNLNRTRDGAGEDRSKGGNDTGTSEDDGQAARRELKDTLARERKRIEQLDVPHEARQ